jgi:hypothetical protein
MSHHDHHDDDQHDVDQHDVEHDHDAASFLEPPPAACVAWPV